MAVPGPACTTLKHVEREWMATWLLCPVPGELAIATTTVVRECYKRRTVL